MVAETVSERIKEFKSVSLWVPLADQTAWMTLSLPLRSSRIYITDSTKVAWYRLDYVLSDIIGQDFYNFTDASSWAYSVSLYSTQLLWSHSAGARHQWAVNRAIENIICVMWNFPRTKFAYVCKDLPEPLNFWGLTLEIIRTTPIALTNQKT